MARGITFNCETGESEVRELTGDELAAHEALRAIPPVKFPPSTADLLDAVAAKLEAATTPKQQAEAVRDLAKALRGTA